MINDEEIAARLAVIEERLKGLEDMKEDFQKFKGFAGGVIFVVSSLFTILMLVKERLFGG